MSSKIYTTSGEEQVSDGTFAREPVTLIEIRLFEYSLSDEKKSLACQKHSSSYLMSSVVETWSVQQGVSSRSIV